MYPKPSQLSGVVSSSALLTYFRDILKVGSFGDILGKSLGPIWLKEFVWKSLWKGYTDSLYIDVTQI